MGDVYNKLIKKNDEKWVDKRGFIETLQYKDVNNLPQFDSWYHYFHSPINYAVICSNGEVYSVRNDNEAPEESRGSCIDARNKKCKHLGGRSNESDYRYDDLNASAPIKTYEWFKPSMKNNFSIINGRYDCFNLPNGAINNKLFHVLYYEIEPNGNFKFEIRKLNRNEGIFTAVGNTEHIYNGHRCIYAGSYGWYILNTLNLPTVNILFIPVYMVKYKQNKDTVYDGKNLNRWIKDNFNTLTNNFGNCNIDMSRINGHTKQLMIRSYGAILKCGGEGRPNFGKNFVNSEAGFEETILRDICDTEAFPKGIYFWSPEHAGSNHGMSMRDYDTPQILGVGWKEYWFEVHIGPATEISSEPYILDRRVIV